MKTYRDQGAIGAILDEMEKALQELKDVITPVSGDQLKLIVDHETKDEDCRSIQTILSHVIGAGYNYIVYCRRAQGEEIERMAKPVLESISEYQQALDKMMEFNVQFFKDYPAVKLNEEDIDKRFVVPWGISYDVESLMEHAIVHILRHRRQIERFLLRM